MEGTRGARGHDSHLINGIQALLEPRLQLGRPDALWERADIPQDPDGRMLTKLLGLVTHCDQDGQDAPERLPKPVRVMLVEPRVCEHVHAPQRERLAFVGL